MIELTMVPGTLQDAEALVGTEIAVLDGADPVNAPMIRHHLEVYEWDFPPATDEAAARATGYLTVCAPSAMFMTFGMPAYWTPAGPPIGPLTLAPLPFGQVPDLVPPCSRPGPRSSFTSPCTQETGCRPPGGSRA